jgi:signal transduction histidine kinase
LEIFTEISEQGKITAPRREFIHAITHLMDNAFKFGHERGHVRLKVQPGSNGGVDIEIQDDGPGISANLHEKVFERFYQGSQGDSRGHEGLGVGLTIARAVFQSLRGNVEIHDSTQGTLVRAFIPDHGPQDIVYG